MEFIIIYLGTLLLLFFADWGLRSNHIRLLQIAGVLALISIPLLSVMHLSVTAAIVMAVGSLGACFLIPIGLLRGIFRRFRPLANFLDGTSLRFPLVWLPMRVLGYFIVVIPLVVLGIAAMVGGFYWLQLCEGLFTHHPGPR